MSTTQPSPGSFQSATSDDLAVIRGVGRCLLLLIFSFGLWSFAWIYHTTKEVSSRVTQPPPSAGLRTFLYAIPIANLVMWFKAWDDIDKYSKRTGAGGFPFAVFWIITFLFGFPGIVTYPVVQSRLNDAHRMATQGQARTAKMQTADWIAIGVGWAFVLLFVIIVIAAAGGSSSS
jgi:hypothetical protein